MIKEEIIGKKFNHLTVIELDEERNQESWRRYKNGEIKRRPIYYLCKCDCGKENLISVEKPSLMRKNNPIKSCGCQRRMSNNNRKGIYYPPNDLVGKRFGRLEVLSKSNNRSGERKKIMWNCKCDCGNYIDVIGECLKSETTKSCGCIYKESRHEIMKSYNTYDLESEDYGIGYCKNGSEFYFDKEDYELIKDYCWNYDGRYVNTHNIQSIESEYTTKIIRLHRLVLNINDRENIEIDHKNTIRYDCRKENLRRATSSQNSFNKIETFATKENPVGIYKENKKFSVYIQKQRIGLYDTFEEAFEVRKEKEKENFGEFLYNPRHED